MKRYIMFVVIVFYGCSVLSAQRKIMLSDVSNSFRIGDSIRYDLVDMETSVSQRMMNRHGISQILSIWERREKCPSMVRILQRLG